MAHDEKLKPEDFPVHAKQKKAVKNDGKTVADASDKQIAEDVAERLNAEEGLRDKTAGRHNGPEFPAASASPGWGRFFLASPSELRPRS